MVMQIKIPWQCQEILNRFSEHHLQAYLVGGCVRDSLLGMEPKDWDICTEALPEQILELFSADKVILTGLQHGTVTVLLGGLPVEITTFRIDGEYEDNRHPKEVFFTANLWEDLSRRDFTINALAYHPQEGIIDYFDGIADLRQGIIRCVGNAASRYQEDGLRIMRAVRFACVLNFRFEAETEAAICRYNYLLTNIARERIQVEFNKILLSSWAAYGLETLARLGCFSYFMPELCHIWQFGEKDLFQHTVRAVRQVPEQLGLRLTMLLHDIGKPFVWQERDGVDFFPDFELTGALLAERILERLRYDKKTIAQVKQLILHQNRLLSDSPVCIRQAVADLGVERVQQLFLVKRAELLSSRKQQIQLEELDCANCLLQQILQRGDCCSLRELAVSGRDLLDLGIKGKQVGLTLNKLLQLVLEYPEKNEKQILLNWVKREII